MLDIWFLIISLAFFQYAGFIMIVAFNPWIFFLFSAPVVFSNYLMLLIIGIPTNFVFGCFVGAILTPLIVFLDQHRPYMKDRT